ncbi:MAG: hypothetical protein MI974_10310 [Chitinophagales bacterium]|nr:hypothetical protein [Chitinophagales bacterium]
MYDQHHESPPAIIPLTIKEGEHLFINSLTKKQESYYSNGIIAQVKTTLMETHVPGTPVSLNEKMAPVLTKMKKNCCFLSGMIMNYPFLFHRMVLTEDGFAKL